MSPPVTSYVYKSPGKAKLRKKVVNIYIISVKVELLLFADTQDIDPVDYCHFRSVCLQALKGESKQNVL